MYLSILYCFILTYWTFICLSNIQGEKERKLTVAYNYFVKPFSHFSLLEFANETRIKLNVSGRGGGSGSSYFLCSPRNESGQRNGLSEMLCG